MQVYYECRISIFMMVFDMTNILAKVSLVLFGCALGLGEGLAQPATNTRLEFEKFYEANHAPFYCFSDGGKASEFKSVDVRWTWKADAKTLWIAETVENNKVNGIVANVADLQDVVATIPYDCDKGSIVHVAVFCIENCVIEYDPDTVKGDLEKFFKQVLGLKRETVYFTFKDQAAANKALALWRKIIREARQPSVQ